MSMAEHTMGSAAAIDMLEDIMSALRDHNIPAPDYGPSTEAH
jgi:hypothetical protein